jgi:hypothetical protein
VSARGEMCFECVMGDKRACAIQALLCVYWCEMVFVGALL